MKLPLLYPIVDIESLSRRDWILHDFVRRLLDGGAEILQLRDKQSAPEPVLRHASVITEALEGSVCLPVMNDRADLAVLAGWKAVHVGHRDLPPDAARRVFGDGGGERAIVGVSTHNEEQVMVAEGTSADYLAVGPVFATGTKGDAEPVIGLEGVRRARALTSKPLVAIGGITRENAAAVREAGADSVAVIGALFARGEAVDEAVRDFLRLLR